MSRLSRGKAQLRAALARKENGQRGKVVPFQTPSARKLSS
jgi:RNA polymerase sigma-70 factor (ECF subfamily)